MSRWLSAREAARAVKAAELAEGDLIEWARQGLLRARAKVGTFSSDDPFEKRVFPKEPPLDELERLALGPWPDIPPEFWGEQPSKALWGACTFAARIGFWHEYHQSYEYERIELFGVTFNADEIEALLNGSPPKNGDMSAATEEWQQQRVTEQQRVVFEFFDVARNFPLNAPLGPVALHRRYCDEVKKKNNGKPLVRTAFSKWQSRFNHGWRVDGTKWKHIP